MYKKLEYIILKGMEQNINYVAVSPPKRKEKAPGHLQIVLGFVCSLLAVAIFPLLFGPLGMVLGWQAKSRGAGTLSLLVIFTALVAMVIGITIQMYIINNLSFVVKMPDLLQTSETLIKTLSF